MKLFYSTESPYARKVRIAVREWGLLDRVEEVALDPWTDPAVLHSHNPLGKVPALLTDDGWTLPDSRLILDYLGQFRDDGAKLDDDWDIARRAQLADGLIDASVALAMERLKRPSEYQWPEWIARQQAAIERTLDTLEIEAVALQENEANGDEISLCCALAFLDDRFPEAEWCTRCPGLALWYECFAQRASIVETRVRS